MLSKEQRDELAEHYRGKDLYDPSKDPSQEPPDFTPKMCNGGEMNFDEGGAVPDLGDAAALFGGDTSDFSGPTISAGTDTVKTNLSPEAIQAMPAADTDLKDALTSVVTPPAQPQVAPTSVKPPPGLNPADLAYAGRSMAQTDADTATPAPQAAPAAPQGTSGLSKDFSELLASLKPGLGQQLAQGAMSGLGGLADAIATGVARAPSPGFQKTINEQSQLGKQNLLEAIKAKHEIGLKASGQNIDRARLAAEIDNWAKERGLSKSAQDIDRTRVAQEGANMQASRGLESAKNQIDAAKATVEAYEKGSGWFGAKLGQTRPSEQEYNAAKKVLASGGQASQAHPQDQQAVAWANAHPTDPRAAKILKANGF